MILQTPVQPVMEGQTVTLLCKTSFNLNQISISRDDGQRINNINVTMENVTKAHEGFYKCVNTNASVESPESWLSVRGEEIKSALFSVNLKLFRRSVL